MTASNNAARAGGILPTATDGALRLRYLEEVGALLWPPPARAEVVSASTRTAATQAAATRAASGHAGDSTGDDGGTAGDDGGDGAAGDTRGALGGRGNGARLGEFILVPDAKRPRLLVPAADRRAAAAAVRRYAEPGSTRLRITLGLLSAALASGLGGLLMRDRVVISRTADADAADTGEGTDTGEGAGKADGRADTIEHYLRGALGTDLVLSLHVGPARANRKPVLQLLTRDGATTGFAKLGINDLTRTLVRAEHESLLEVSGAGLRHTTVPSVLHHGRWNDLEVLVQSPLPVWERRAPTTPDRLAATLVEIAEIGGVRTEPLRASAYWARLGARLDALDQGSAAGSLRSAYERIGERTSDADTLRFGAWHGDLTPWNMATLRDTICVWDWERFSRGVPLGFDAVHYAFQGAVVRHKRDPRAAIADCVRRAPELLAPFGQGGSGGPAGAGTTGDGKAKGEGATSGGPGADGSSADGSSADGSSADGSSAERAARLTVVLYLIDIAARYLHDGQAEAGARLGALGQWLLPVLVDEVERF
jgi:hypothetical protein